MREAYQALHAAGFAHSFELWQGNTLAGGLYGVAIGRMFFGESMFSRIPNASKIVMVYVSRFLQQHQFPLLDCQVYNPHLTRMGAREISQADFLSIVNYAVHASQDSAIWKTQSIDCFSLI